MKIKYTIIKELANGNSRETPIFNIGMVLLELKKELVNLKEGEKISVIKIK